MCIVITIYSDGNTLQCRNVSKLLFKPPNIGMALRYGIAHQVVGQTWTNEY